MPPHFPHSVDLQVLVEDAPDFAAQGAVALKRQHEPQRFVGDIVETGNESWRFKNRA